MSDSVVQDPALDAAVKLHQAGKLDRAARAYREILAQHPDHANALHLLGAIELQSGRFAEAVELIARAVAIQPNVGVYHVNLAAAMRALGRIDDAIAEAENAIVLDEKLAAQGYHIAALAFADGGQPLDAIECWTKALAAQPEFAEAHLAIAGLMDSMGKYYFALTQQQHAERVSREQVAREPDSAPAHMLLGRSLEQGGKLDEAAAEYRAAARLLPHDATVFHALGRALYRQGQSDEAMTSLRFAVRMNPKLPDAHVALAALLLSQGRAADAIESLRTALSLLPDHVEARAKLADALAQTGEIEQAVVAARAAVQAAPHSAVARSTLLRRLLLDARVTPEELFREHAEWGKIHGAAMQFAFDEHVKWERRTAAEADEASRPVAIDKNPDRPLRIGFVSPHFARHPLAKFLIPLLENFDRKQFAVFCYSDAPPGGANDEVTEDFKKLASTWRETARWTDTQLALLVRTDKIDVLVDLTGHGEGNRLLTFGQRPAPVQVTQFGYPFTTGLSAIGYRVSDEITDPPGALDALHSERLVRLAHPAICFRPWERTPARLEARHASEPITFGCVNDAARLSLQTIQTWAKLMMAVPDARLLVMSSTRDVEATRARLTRLGLEPFRLIVVAPEQGTRYLDLFNQMDILLDTFPCSGGMIAGDALWMATPVVTLAGPMPASRGAALFLNSVGLDDLIAATPGQYVDLAAALANDRKRLERLAHSLRERLVRSSVCDARACAAAMMDFYRDAWRRYCLMND